MSRMPRMRHGLGAALDADRHERVPSLVDLDRRPAKKGRKTKGSKRSPGSKAAGGHAAPDAGDADAEMRWGAELVLQLALGGHVPPSASRDALAPPGKARKGRVDDPSERSAGAPSGASSEPIGAGRHVLVGDPIVVPSRRTASDGDIVRGPADPRLARGAGSDASALGLPTGPTLAKERRDQASDAFNSVAAAASQHAPLAPLRLAARAALPQAALRTPDQTHAGSKPGGDANSLCARILAARATADDDDSRAPRGCPSHASTHTAHTPPGSRSHFPALEDSFAQAFRVLQNAAAALVRAHAEAGADGQSTEARRSSSLADPASLLALLDSDQAAAARAVLEQLAHAGAGAGAGSDRKAEGHRTALTALASAPATEAAHYPETTPARLRAPETQTLSVERDLSLAPAVARALASARGAGVFAPPPEVLAARFSPPEVLVARSPPPSAAGRSPFKRGRSSSAFRGVTLHRRTRRWESHIWVRETGKQLYLGGFDLERSAAEAHDLCALKLRGKKNVRGLNFPLSTYARANDALDRMSHEQVVAAVRAGRLTARGGFEGARTVDA